MRRAQQAARRKQAQGDAARKIESIRKAARHDYPTADVDQMNAEIDRDVETDPPR